ncbi:hypothetical protein [Tropicimonas sp.]|uniref:hypothetical protein n=1 Tax=Tropicimonas sp. TaxID=2067044 RepID=UPI003A8A0675
MNEAHAPVLASFHADRETYVRGHVVLAALGALIASAVLIALGNADVWVGPVGAVLAVVLRGYYLASEELAVRWDLTAARLVCNNGRSLRLDQIAQVRRLGSSVQVITRGGDKYLLKYQRDPDTVRRRIEQAAGRQT